MGLSIHYSGRFRNPVSLSEMIEEVKDIAEFNKWKYSIFDEQFPENTFAKSSYNQDVYGICITPPKCETISLSFLSNGRMSDLLHLKNFGNSDDKQYFQDFKMMDEGEYWEMGDKKHTNEFYEIKKEQEIVQTKADL